MDLNNIQINLRPRSALEAVDLGTQLAKQHFATMIGAWLILTTPLFAILTLFMPKSVWPIVILWWLKPIFERVHLLILSRAVFGDIPTISQAAKSFFGVAKNQCFSSLTWRRLSFARSFDLPVVQLEGLSSEQRSKRLQVLRRFSDNAGGWLTFLYVHIEMFLSTAILALIYVFLPEHVEFDVFEWVQQQTDFIILNNSITFLVMALVAPFYVASGFSMYLNRRILLEGWDIELRFKQLVENSKKTTKVRDRKINQALSSVVITLLLCASANLLPTNTLQASESKTTSIEVIDREDCQQEEANCLDINQLSKTEFKSERLSKEQARSIIDELFASDDFNQKETYSYPAFLESDDPDEDEIKDMLDDDAGGIKAFFQGLAQILEFLLWAGLIALIAWLLYRYREQLADLIGYGNRLFDKPKFDAPETMFGMDVTKESLPDDIVAQANQLWNQDQKRQAIGLLYRASLSLLITEYQAEFLPGMTEGDCNQVVKALNQAKIAQLFSALTSAWIMVAYAHESPTQATFEQLSRSWNDTFFQYTPAAKHGGDA